MKKYNKITALILTVAAVCLMIAGCSGGGHKSVSMYDLSRDMLSATEFGDMVYVSSSDDAAEDLLVNVSDISYSKVEAFFFAYDRKGEGNADEIVVIALKDQKDAKQAADSLRAHLENRKKLYATYDPSQLPKLEEATVFTKDNLAVLIVSGDNKAVRSAFENFLAGAEG